MHETTPKVRLIAEPQVNISQVADYLEEVGASDWIFEYFETEDHEHFAGDLLAEIAGRLCYKSWKPGLNANVTKVREDHEAYIGNILSSKHGAVTEHAQYTFILQDISRVVTHELVRHRVGVAISQESLRYVRLTDLGFRFPAALTEHEAWTKADRAPNGELVELPLDTIARDLLRQMESFQLLAADRFGLDDPGVPFHLKKVITSALRRFAPLGLSTSMVWSANIRTLRHTIALRTDPSAEEEIRLVFADIADVMEEAAPYAFQDMRIGDDNLHRVFENWKV